MKYTIGKQNLEKYSFNFIQIVYLKNFFYTCSKIITPKNV